MILLFLAVVMLIFAIIKKQYKFTLVGIEVGLFGSVQELLQKPELAQYSELLNVVGCVCLLAVTLTLILLAVGGVKKDGK